MKLEKGWSKHLRGEFEKPYMLELREFLDKEYSKGKTIYPEKDSIFAAFNHTPFDKVKVVIIGQDPYHGSGQAHGLCFSVRPGVKVPPSLQNIYKELNRDLGLKIPASGYLVDWAKQGVLLLNATLTVEAGRAGSHQKKGWETFTDKVVDVLNKDKENLIFVLWGSYAQKKGENISDKHLALKSTHPSPLSAYRGFLGCGHFSVINKKLKSMGKPEINWQVNESL
jgi:uracil-DNA glycosylase